MLLRSVSFNGSVDSLIYKYSQLQIKGSTAQMDGRIMIGDQILAINDVDVENKSQEEVATLLKVSYLT